MTLKQAMKRIEELEQRVRALEARPAGTTHFHYHQPPQPIYQPPWQPLGPVWTFGAGSIVGGDQQYQLPQN